MFGGWETYSIGKLHARPTGSGFSGLWPFALPLATVRCILSAIQSKNSVPRRFLTSLSILKDSIRTMPLSEPDASRPLSSTNATRSVDPPTSRARYWPDSWPVGRCELYEGSMHSGFDRRRSRNWRFSFLENFFRPPPSMYPRKRCSISARKSAAGSAWALVDPALGVVTGTTGLAVQKASNALRNDLPRKTDRRAATKASRSDVMVETSGIAARH